MYARMGSTARFWTMIGVILLTILQQTRSKPQRVFSRGYNSRNLPPGGWTVWFNVDYPSGAGDFEIYQSIVAVYGRGCMGIPCRIPLGVKVKSVYNLSPAQEGNTVVITPRRGLSCTEHHQLYKKCADYRVRFYCAGMHELCHSRRRNSWYHKRYGAATTTPTVTSEPPINANETYLTREPPTGVLPYTKLTEERKNGSRVNSALEKNPHRGGISNIFRGGGVRNQN